MGGGSTPSACMCARVLCAGAVLLSSCWPILPYRSKLLQIPSVLVACSTSLRSKPRITCGHKSCIGAALCSLCKRARTGVTDSKKRSRMSSDQPPSLRLELAAATAQWAVQHGAALHEHLRLEERDDRGVCLVAVDAIDANTTIIRIPRTLCVTSHDARKDEDV